jgi:hypothetical protein
MTGKTKLKLYLCCPTPNCPGELSASHIKDGQEFGPWMCKTCNGYFKGRREGVSFELTLMPELHTDKITVTLQSQTTPPITLRINSYQYSGPNPMNAEDAWNHARYFYNAHTCPTNYMRDVTEIIYEGSSDPHGVFEFVSLEYGHIGDKE